MLLFEENWGKYNFLAVFLPMATAEMFILPWPNFNPLIIIIIWVMKDLVNLASPGGWNKAHAMRVRIYVEYIPSCNLEQITRFSFCRQCILHP